MNNFGLIQNQVQYMPDALLAQEVQNPNGAIPQYMALAELNRRQKLRQSAPVQQPQGTVAQDVLKSIHAAGMQPGMAQQTRPQQGIMSATAPSPMQPGPGIGYSTPSATITDRPFASMRNGGIVRLANNGNGGTVGQNINAPNLPPVQYDDDSTPAQGIAQAAPQQQQSLSGQQMTEALGIGQIPDYMSGYTPTPQTSMGDAVKQIRSLYGPGEDYSEVLNGIRGLRDQNRPMSDRDRFELAGLLAGASKEANPIVATNQGIIDAWQAQRQQQQLYYNNAMKSYEDQYGIQKATEGRRDAIAGDVLKYLENQNQMAVLRDRNDVTAREAMEKLAIENGKIWPELLKAGGKDPGVFGAIKSGADFSLQNAMPGTPEYQRAKNAADLANSLESGVQSALQMQEDNKANAALPGKLAVAALENKGKLDVANLNVKQNIPDLQDIVQTTYGNRQYIDGSQLHGKIYDSVFKQASDAGIPVVSKDVASTLAELDTARKNQDFMLSQLQARLAKDPSGRFYSSSKNTIERLSQTDPVLATIGSFRNAAIQTLRAVAGSKGLRINQAEIQLALDNDLPKPTDTLPVAMQRIANLKKFMDNVESSNLVRNRSNTSDSGSFSVTDPKGNIHYFNSQADLDAFKKEAGINK